jgi:ABC-type Fe3+-hydroxamate transport system substrate-binding protein
LSSEGLIELNPDIIIEILNVDDMDVWEPLRFWQQFSKVAAVKNNRVIALSEDFASIPGPRYIQLLELLTKRIYATS